MGDCYNFDLHEVAAAIVDMNPEDRKILVDALDGCGALSKQKTPARRKSPSKKVSADKRSVFDFNPDTCHARLIEESKWDNGSPVYQHSDPRIHLGCYPVQCTGTKVDGNFCKHCSSAKKRICQKQGPNPFGTFDDTTTCPENPFRMSAKGKSHTYVWMQKTEEEYDEFLTHEEDSAPTKKYSASSNDSDTDIDWNELVLKDDWKKVRVPMLKAHLKEKGCDTKGSKDDLIYRIKDIYLPDDQEPEQPEQPEQPHNPAATQASLSTEVVADVPAPDDAPASLDNASLHAETSEDEDDDDDDDVPEELEVQGVTYVITTQGIQDKKSLAIIHKNPDERDPTQWSKKSQTRHQKNITALMEEK